MVYGYIQPATVGVEVGLGVSVGGADVMTVICAGGRVAAGESTCEARQAEKLKRNIRLAVNLWTKTGKRLDTGPILSQMKGMLIYRW
jgi:hypothetical protein